jgi:hypothetical protein
MGAPSREEGKLRLFSFLGTDARNGTEFTLRIGVQVRSEKPMKKLFYELKKAIYLTLVGGFGMIIPLLLNAQDSSSTQDKATTPTAKKLTDASKQGVPLITDSDKLQNVAVEAVLLPERVCREVFGSEIAKNYAAVELTIENHNRDASLIVQSIYIDFSDWALSGPKVQARVCATGACTQPNQISSVEYRVARGEMLDRQPWTARNITIRGLEMLGAVASAYTFTLSSQQAIKSISAANGEAIPALANFWPDGLIGQMNRISDVGFQVNKIIPKESSDIIVAFFPIDRFLTPGFKKLFLKSPTLFFAPGTVFLDNKAVAMLQPDLEFLLGGKEKVREATRGLAKYVALEAQVTSLTSRIRELNIELTTSKHGTEGNGLSEGEVQDELNNLHDKLTAAQTELTSSSCTDGCAAILSYLDRISLNNVRVVVGGIMTVDVNTVPATITSVDLDGGNSNPNSWTKGDHSGSIAGSYLQNGTPVLVKPPNGVTITAVQDGSTENVLRFKLTLPDKFLTTSETKLTFMVTKKDKTGKATDSSTYDLPVPAVEEKK